MAAGDRAGPHALNPFRSLPGFPRDRPTRTVGLKQSLAEQLALVAERPETFEVQFTTRNFGWVVVQLEGVERDELAELTFEAWRLAPAGLVDQRGDRLPT